MGLPRIEVWWMSYDPESPLPSRAWAELPAPDRGRAGRMPSRRRGREWAAARWLVRYALARRLGPCAWTGTLEPGQALPGTAGRPGWSLSHDEGVVAVAVADAAAVGIDVLAHASRDAGAHEAIERVLPAGLPGDDPCDRWMRAEAFLKCTGTGWAEAASMVRGSGVRGTAVVFHALRGGPAAAGVVASDAADVPVEHRVALP